MSNNFFITGLPKTGKTTVLRTLAGELKRRGFRVGGFLSPEIREHGMRSGFYVQDIETGQQAVLAEVGAGGPRVGKYHVNVKGFESVVLAGLRDSNRYDVLIIDEIGKMELESEKFGDILADLLQTPLPVVASLHGQYVQTYGIYGTVYRLTETNRGAVYMELLDRLVPTLRKKPPQKLKFEKKTEMERPKPAKKKKRKMGRPFPTKKESEGKQEKPRKRSLWERVRGWLKRV